MNSLSNIRIVLDHTSHPGNIGAAARAMKVMGLEQLHLVNPSRFPHAQATALASSADSVLDAAQVHATLDEALAGCTLVLGTSARKRSVSQELLEPREAAARLMAQERPVAVLFGRERSGLENDALDRCHHLVCIPTGDQYMSLNLAQAVQVLTYEMFLAARAGQPQAPGHEPRPLARAERMQVFFERLERTVRAIRFSTPGQTETLHRRLRHLFMRAAPDDDELNMLNGILSKTLKIAQQHDFESKTEPGEQ
ncbi:MAG: RNA methyltransferase [Wenzhouxiangellaceae bacterium]|nr:RNA methyltransferase [Wenzhouxiangellaceae bacterium]